MTVSGISGTSIQFPSSTQMNQMKQNFDDLGTALKSGNLDDAKKALATLQQNAPAQASDSNNPMAIDMKTLSNAINSGDLKTAQDTYSKIQSNQAKAPSGGSMPKPQGDTVTLSSQAAASGGKAAASGGQAKSSASASASSSSSSSLTKTYDKMDANKDGKVSIKEELDYKAKHPDEKDSASTSSAKSETSTSEKSTSEKSTSEDGTAESKVETYA
ncbi:hypothetical protein [Geomesophilobacter sediminis]|uniref:EF-hand domain-containing protein n=1 Tax=Geomesophilobacter sediminis TaxID=2798584 RepID=A0A8J7J404_9BACT|nr:hypothetical protein [Geomesophilobacter sediminis]MBJ6725458.1 hypothetical protein [Geomesophilobacter sediminis]